MVTIAIVKMVIGTLSMTITDSEYASPTDALLPCFVKLSLQAGHANTSAAAMNRTNTIDAIVFMMQVRTIGTT